MVSVFRNLPPSSSPDWMFHDCKDFMRSNNQYISVKPIYGEVRTFFGRALIGRTVRIDFGKQGIFKGSIVNYDANREKEEYEVHFVDDDT